VTDVVMRPMDGIQAAIVIQSIRPDCKVLLLSGNTQTASFLATAVLFPIALIGMVGSTQEAIGEALRTAVA
jgi:DNA-binding NarL/FixJ family response regulator